MSGSKGYQYTVISAAELRRREDEALTRRCEQQAITLAGLNGQLRSFGVPASDSVSEPSGRTREALLAWESSLQAALRDAEARILTESTKAIRRRLGLSMGHVDVAGVSLGATRAPNRHTSSTPTTADLARVSAEVAKVVDLIAGLRDASAREDLTRLAERVARTSSPAQAKGDLLTLKTKASTALQVQGYRDLAAQAALEIAHVTAPEADAVRARAAVVTSAQDLSEVRRTVTDLVAADTRARDAEFVEAALEDVLAELGFGIGEGFDVADLGRSVAVATHAEHPGYGVRVQLNPSNGMIYTRVVAQRAGTPEEDARAEDATCDKVHAMASRLHGHGVAADLSFARQSGEVPLERVAAKPAGARRKRPRSRSTQQTRTAR